MYAKLHSLGLYGIDCFVISVEVDLMHNMPAFDIVGLPDAAVKEARDRVRHAMKNSGYMFPTSKITVNLAPADIRKVGPVYDLPIFLAILQSSRQLDANTDGYCFVGELSLSGDITPINGVLPMVIKAKEAGFHSIVVPAKNAAEASLIDGIQVLGASNVEEVIAHLKGKRRIAPAQKVDFTALRDHSDFLDFADVKGQEGAKYAMEIAAAGGHNLLMIGAPGSGKSMLAKRLPSILPKLSFEESIEVTKVHSVAGELDPEHPFVVQRPFRAPHHTVSPAGLSGGGTVPRPGEISLAHNGVLFLDELPEFPRSSMEVLRQPIEDGRVTISRVNSTLTYPCSIMLVAAMNPCPCGYFGHPTRRCTCSDSAVSRYLAKVSGPLLDRLDLHVEVMPVEFENLASKQRGESSAEIRKRVDAAREIQRLRLEKHHITCNAKITSAIIDEVCPMSDKAIAMLKNAFDRMGLSARAYDKLLKVSRTIADLNQSEVIQAEHIAQAIQYRSLDRKYWNRA